MADIHFTDLSIKGFRGIRELDIAPLGRVTLITGENNAGKSSVLEALRLYAQNATPTTLYSILAYREEYVRGTNEDEWFFDPETMFHVSSIFHGFPSLHGKIEPISISTRSNRRKRTLELRVEWHFEEIDSEGVLRLVPQMTLIDDVVDAIPVLVVKTERRTRTHRIERLPQYARSRGRPPEDLPRIPCQVVGPYVGATTNTLAGLLDDIALTASERDAIEALQIIEPRIDAVRAIGGDGPTRARTVIVGASHIDRPIPLRSFGDGMNHLFAVVLSLIGARGGILLVDEFENGLHHSVQFDAWRLIFRLAPRLNVQVFATSHSKDAVEAFREAAAETQEEGSLVHLTRRGDETFASVLGEEALYLASRDRIEVR